MSNEAIFAGFAAVITGAAGLALVIREFRNREHRAARTEIKHLTSDLYRVEAAYVELRRYAYKLRQMIADRGDDVPTAPLIHELEPDL